MPDSVETTAEVHLDKGDGGLLDHAQRPHHRGEGRRASTDEGFQEYADEAKRNCPVSRALGAIEIGLEAKLAYVVEAADVVREADRRKATG